MDKTKYKSTVTEAFNNAAATYDQLGVEFFTPMGRRLVERADPRPGQRVLDVGCGRGASLFVAAERVGPSGHVLGIDIAPAMVEEARRQAAALGARQVEVRVMDGEHPDFPPASFDVVTGSYSLIFLPDAPAALPRYAALLRPGGRIAFTSPVFTEDTFPFLPPVFTELIPERLLRNLPADWRPDALKRRFNSWLQDTGDLTRTMIDAGFEDVEIADEHIDLRAPDGETWVDWSHTQGMRLLWQHLPEYENRQLRHRLTTELDRLRGEGPLHLPTPVRFVSASIAD
ncbi:MULTISPECIES: class I SAM-dependent methyltransferase [Streptomyces]|uniref:Methyltransferase domain-containing protein n=1 Tax=Streptomyces koelreuteriae TaxID=2838015 RepID=A0ABX8FS41_9ACTN|nr:MULTISPECIES: class I SAM-dependent methyltransferase [Streptomyces]QWB24013.1 methyltransferase domain-containing protein [Streptomyces koelreuteriae]UUA06997.1 methyltransferase domain-containing protein [Streptomyces koelreuteriae]UUA14626.1 methyltransferase domain-containing protein [Streptomyces sp. CRCS-T-1]